MCAQPSIVPTIVFCVKVLWGEVLYVLEQVSVFLFYPLDVCNEIVYFTDVGKNIKPIADPV